MGTHFCLGRLILKSVTKNLVHDEISLVPSFRENHTSALLTEESDSGLNVCPALGPAFGQVLTAGSHWMTRRMGGGLFIAIPNHIRIQDHKIP